MKVDFCRCNAVLEANDAENAVADNAHTTYEETFGIAGFGLAVTHRIRYGQWFKMCFF